MVCNVGIQPTASNRTIVGLSLCMHGVSISLAPPTHIDSYVAFRIIMQCPRANAAATGGRLPPKISPMDSFVHGGIARSAHYESLRPPDDHMEVLSPVRRCEQSGNSSPYIFSNFSCRQLRYRMRNIPFTANPHEVETRGTTNWGGLPVRSFVKRTSPPVSISPFIHAGNLPPTR